MKTPPVKTLLAFALNVVGGATLLFAQGPLSTGFIESISKENGTLTLRAEPNQPAQIVYHGMDKAQIVTASGKPMTFADLKPGLSATVFYAKQGDRWIVSRVLVPDETPLPVPQTTTAVVPRAATDGDITTRPGSNATRDNDRTTQPGSKAATDDDRTTQPGSNAARDGDRTTQPGSNTARSDADRTTRGPDNAATDGDRTTVPARK